MTWLIAVAFGQLAWWGTEVISNVLISESGSASVPRHGIHIVHDRVVCSSGVVVKQRGCYRRYGRH